MFGSFCFVFFLLILSLLEPEALLKSKCLGDLFYELH